jgi:MerR family transcriptional regulator, light-induced transcriptional regulator
MDHFSIRDVENLTGIKAHTLRIWEQRYKFFFPKRRVSQHRYYDSEDLKQLLRIAHLYRNGYKISCIATLKPDEICSIALDLKDGKDSKEKYVNNIIEAALDFDEKKLAKILDELIKKEGMEKAMREVIFKTLEKVGLLWLTGRVIPAQEHFISSIIIQRMIAEIHKLKKVSSTNGRNVLLFTPPGEEHEIPLLFTQWLLKKNQCPHVYFGTNVSTSALEYYCAHRPVTDLYFHLITNLIKKDIQTYVEELSKAFPQKRVLCSGKLIEELQVIPRNVIVLRTDEELVNNLSNYRLGNT